MNTPTTTDQELLTVAEAASRLGVSVRTVQRRVASGQLASEPGPNGSVMVRLESRQVSADAAPAVVVRDALSAALTRYGASLDALDRSKTRWTAAACVAVGVAGVTATVAAALSLGFAERVRSLDATTEQLGTAQTALIDAERRISDLRVSTTQADNLTAALREQLRQVTAERDQLEADVQLVTAERDQLVCELDAADADLAWSSLLSAPVRQLSLDTRDR